MLEAVQCAVCLQRITSPGSLECGHTFCKDCIDRVWDISGQQIRNFKFDLF